jgi:hypothetical protein
LLAAPEEISFEGLIQGRHGIAVFQAGLDAVGQVPVKETGAKRISPADSVDVAGRVSVVVPLILAVISQRSSICQS